MAILGCFWDSANRELYIEAYDSVSRMYLPISELAAGLSADPYAPSPTDQAKIDAALKRAFASCAAAQSPVTEIRYKGPHRDVVQGQRRGGRASFNQSMTPLAELVLQAIDAFSNASLGQLAARKKVGVPTGNVLRAANALIDTFCATGLYRSQKLALFAAMNVGDGVAAFKTVAKQVIRAHLQRQGVYTTARYRADQQSIFSRIA